MTKNELMEKFQTSNLPTDQVFIPLNYVLEQIEQLEEGGGLSNEQMNEIAEEVAGSIINEGINLVDDYDLSMSYREVELDSIDFNESAIERMVKEALKNSVLVVTTEK